MHAVFCPMDAACSMLHVVCYGPMPLDMQPQVVRQLEQELRVVEVPVAVKAIQEVVLDFARKLVGEIVRLGRLHVQQDEARIAAMN